jgi:hypothetical protein
MIHLGHHRRRFLRIRSPVPAHQPRFVRICLRLLMEHKSLIHCTMDVWVRNWQRTQTQSRAMAPRNVRQQMDVRFCSEQKPTGKSQNAQRQRRIGPTTRSPERGQRSRALDLHGCRCLAPTRPPKSKMTNPLVLPALARVFVYFIPCELDYAYLALHKYRVNAKFKRGMHNVVCVYLSEELAARLPHR